MAVPLGPASTDEQSPTNFLPLLLSGTDLQFFLTRLASNPCSHLHTWYTSVELELRHYRGRYLLLFLPRCRHLPACPDSYSPVSRIPPSTCRGSRAWWSHHRRGPGPGGPGGPAGGAAAGY